MSSLSLFTLQGLGNTILALPIVELLRHEFDLSLFLMNNGSSELYRDLFPKMKIHGFDNNRQIMKHRFPKSDVSASLYPNWKRELWALWRSRAKRKILFKDKQSFPTRIVPGEKIERENIHDIENNFKLLEALGVEKRFPDLGYLLPCEKRESACLHPTASNPYKFYPKRFWLSLIRYLDQHEYRIVMFSGNARHETAFCNELLQESKPKIPIEYRQGEKISRVASLILGSQMFVGSDSALMHLAALLDVFTVALWSCADYRRIHPYGNNARVYIPLESTEIKEPAVPSGPLPRLERANPSDVIEILTSLRKESFAIQPKYKQAVKFYVY